MSTLYTYGVLVWFILVVLAIVNGLFREKVLKPRFGEHRARQISCFSFIVLIFITTYVYVNIIGDAYNQNEYLVLGLIWLVLTLIFEFGFGKLRGLSWLELFEDYNIMEGRLWTLVILATFLMPLIVSKII